MGSIFSPPPPVVVSTPFQSASEGSSEIKPYAPVEPFLEQILPEIRQTFTEDPSLFTGSLVPTDAAQTLAARDIYGQVGQTSAGLAPQFMQLGQADIARGLADPSQDPIYQAQLGTISQQARDMTERDKQVAQQQAIEAGQFGLGSTALGELQTMQQQKREELAQRQMSTALGQAEARRIAAAQRAPQMSQQALQAQLTPAALQEAVGKDIEARGAARATDAARLAQQEQEARRAQLVTLTNLFGGLAGLGSSTQMQQTSSGFGSQALGGGASPFSQIASAAATGLGMYNASDVRLKNEITFVGKLENGIKIYKWKWNEKGKELAGDQVEFGVLAQEVQKIVPEAVITGPDGYLMVNYGAL